MTTSDPWVLRRDEKDDCGHYVYVNRPGLRKSYTANALAAQRFDTAEQANNMACKNEHPVRVSVSDFIGVIIPVVGGGNAFIDNEDYELVSGMRWELNRNGYARHRGKGIDILLHRLVMGDPLGLIVDHRDRDRLNCRKYNLRAVPPRINDFNRKPGGIRFDPRRGKWQVRFGQAHVGYRDSEEAAMLLAAQARVDRLGDHAPPWALEILNGKAKQNTCEAVVRQSPEAIAYVG